MILVNKFIHSKTHECRMKASVKKKIGQSEMMSNKEHLVSQISIKFLSQLQPSSLSHNNITLSYCRLRTENNKKYNIIIMMHKFVIKNRIQFSLTIHTVSTSEMWLCNISLIILLHINLFNSVVNTEVRSDKSQHKYCYL